jgi:ribonucleoside-diphosphate reductase beta chain
MKGMGQIVTWSVRDETLHCLSMIRLLNTFVDEHRDVWTDELKEEITQSCRDIVKFEDNFIDLAFEMGGIEGLEGDEVKKYIRYIGDRRLQQIRLEPIFGVEENPLPWMDQMMNGAEHTNFFENRATEYAKAATQGTWEEVFAEDLFSGRYAAPDADASMGSNKDSDAAE